MTTCEGLDGLSAPDNEQLPPLPPSEISEKEEDDEEEARAVSDLPFWYPTLCGKPIFDGNPEALGWACDQIGRSCAFIGSGAFLGPALLELARMHLGCDPDDDSPCEGRVYGWIRPSSLLTTYTVVVGICSAAFLPFLGALTDYTRHRRLLGRCFAASFTLLLFPQIFLSESTFLFVAILQIGVAFTGWAETMVAFAYLPELTKSEQVLNSYTKKFTIISFSTMVIYLLGTYAVGKWMGISDQSVYMSRLGTATAFGIAAVFLSFTWGSLLQKRPPARVLAANHSLYTAGFVQVYNTLKRICRELPVLKWFYLSIAMIEAGFK
jgi:MFS-type transporter involved in bile tolerance (Atg22 family)